jgi:DNA-binding CsgD family transcriptional regulator
MQVTSPVIVGRDAELQLLAGRLAGIRERRGATVFLTGEAGVGKSRLIDECASRAFVAGAPVLRGRASPHSTLMPFRPIAEALFSLFRAGGPPQDPALVPYRPALARLVPEWRTGEPASGDSLVVLAEAVLRLLSVAGGERGCVVVLEDLHDADAETLAVVEYLIDNLADQPVLLLASLRPEAGPAIDLARRSGQRRTATVVELGPLSPPDVSLLAAACLQAEPADLPPPVVDRLVRDGDGNPLVIEELLRAAVAAAAIVCDADGCRIVGELGDDIPSSLVHTVAQRADRLGTHGRDLLNIAATMGRRFSVSVVQEISGLDDRSLLSHLSAAADAQLIGPDATATDWYTFRHALTADALLLSLLPTQRAAIARRVADALIAMDPKLPGDSCQLVARLRLASGQTHEAGELFAEAGRRALADGATASAISLLDRAHELLDADARVNVLESLVDALAEAGQIDRALALTATLAPAPAFTAERARRVLLHTRLAAGAIRAGRWADATARVETARELLGTDAGPDVRAAVDVAEAHVMVAGVGPGLDDAPGRMERAERLALGAAEVAEQLPLPVAACEARQILALLARQRSFEEADAHLTRTLDIADAHGLPIFRVQAMVRLGVNRAMRTGDTAGLEGALQEARAVGAIASVYTVEGSLALEAVLHGDYPRADEITTRCAEATARLGHSDDHRHLLMTRATLAAHQGDRATMDRELAEFRRWGGGQSLQMPVTFGLCRAFCALLEENRPLAADELARVRAWEAGNPRIFYLAGSYGLRVLLSALDGTLCLPEYLDVAATSGAALRWNQQFLLFAHAVLLARAGRADEAVAAVDSAREVSACYPLAHHLGLRLVGEAAITDGWGDPLPWLRTAEEFFHAAGVPAVVGACRALLRRGGATAPQRRDGRARIPAPLLRVGLTVREYEVLVLLAERHGNKDIAGQLFISPRTVEKHVGSVMAKTGCADRATLRRYAATLLE